MAYHYYIHRTRTNTTEETDFFTLADELRDRGADKCFFTTDSDRATIFRHAFDFVWYLEDKHDAETETVTATIDSKGEIISVKATYPDGSEHNAMAVDFID